MGKSLEEDVRKKLVSVVTGKACLRAFNCWFVPAVWDVNDPSTPLGTLVYAVKSLLDHHSNGHLSDNELKEQLRELLAGYGRPEIKVVDLDEFIFHMRFMPTAAGKVDLHLEALTVRETAIDPSKKSEVFNHLAPQPIGVEQLSGPRSRMELAFLTPRPDTLPYEIGPPALPKS